MKNDNQANRKLILCPRDHYSKWVVLKTILICFTICFSACQNDPPANNGKVITLPNTPEGVCRAWQQYIDNNEIAKAMLLGSPSSKEWLKINQSLFLADDELEPTQFITIKCKEEKDKAICKYTLKEEEDMIEDYFSLIKLNNQWLIHIEEQEGNDPNEAIFNEMKKSLNLN